MKSFLVIGAGKFGSQLIKQLYEKGHEVMVIERNEDAINNVLPWTTSARIGDGSNPELLKTLGVGNFDMCFVAIGDNFEGSLETTYYLKQLGAQSVVSMASTDIQSEFLLRNGADDVIYPDRQMARWAAVRYGNSHIIDFTELDSDHSIAVVDPPQKWVGKSILELDVRRMTGINVIGFRRNREVNVSVDPGTVITVDMQLIVAGETKNIEKLFRL